MVKRVAGQYRQANPSSAEAYRTYIPCPLPPKPPLSLTPSHQDLIERANRALGRLDGIARILPDASLFIYFYVRKEAVLSSQIEGTQSSLSDLLLFESDEAPGVPLDDVREVSNYVSAMEHGLKRIRDDDFPLSLRLLREIHQLLLSNGRGAAQSPGEFRRSQNWIGGSRPGNATFVPPPPEEVMGAMGALETFLHDEQERTPLLIKAALAHVQFETIHPFLDGNGRIGRLLITLLLCAEGALSQPFLYLSLYFKERRTEYYERLQRVRDHGDWEGWLTFFLQGILETAERATETAISAHELFLEDRKTISAKLGKSANTALRLQELMQRKPIVKISSASDELNISVPTITSALERLQDLGMVKELTGRQRGRVFAYEKYLRVLQEHVE